MKTSSEIDQSLNRTLTILISAIIHAVLMVGICCSATEQKEKPIAVATKMIELKTMPLPPSPKPEPPKKAETPPPPPKPVEPPPPPPKKETPPPPPKPVEVKPVEVKPPTPKPAVVKTETPKPVETQKTTLTKQEEFLERFKKAETKKIDDRPQRQQPQPSPTPLPIQTAPTKSAAQIANQAMSHVSKTPRALPSFTGQTTADISEEYAEQYVRPVLEPIWKPSRAGMGIKSPSPVKITFVVSLEGSVSNVRISKKSNEPIMNSSVEELINQIRSGQISFVSPRNAGIKQPFLTVEIELRLKD